MVSQGNLIIAIVIPIVIPIGLAMFVFFFALQYKYLKRVRVRLEFQEQMARRTQVRKAGLSKYDILHYCPLLIYKGSSKASLHPEKLIIEQVAPKKDDEECGQLSTLEERGGSFPVTDNEDKRSETRKREYSTKGFEEGDVLVISIVNPGNNEWLHVGGEREVLSRSSSSKKTKQDNTPLLSAKAIPGGICSICLEEVKKESRLRLLRCGHAFHCRCIERWLGSVNRCPLCNSTAVDRPTFSVAEVSSTGEIALPLPQPTNSPSLERGNIFQRIGHWFREAFSDVPPELRNVTLQNSPTQPLPRFSGVSVARTSAQGEDDDEEAGGRSEEGRLSSMYRDGNQHMVEYVDE
ncbi:zinc finger (C3HC4-type RING finger) family protein [Galdieria sulphuraria]|uniref:RING-type E3 ubiquitin transferase n=1 Tax=Galdieria sulphuraria TaxID=130081 RepID=M2XSB9_GALSU|nr:zinc finger (C3HC4-type RING finger) family protein [Galdieria sulphuraria]EME26568.1 zinc finger (C3HC4-type RING finger) family protein [Galdieria sulphuraria]|eukprot:XP_005703088.1 zinc finger (C3HC4-type RING finger) family protein [Galdieria sulphuraria]